MAQGVQNNEYEFITCIECKEVKHRGSFHISVYHFNGRQSACIKCKTGEEEESNTKPVWDAVPDIITKCLPYQ